MRLFLPLSGVSHRKIRLFCAKLSKISLFSLLFCPVSAAKKDLSIFYIIIFFPSIFTSQTPMAK